MGKHEGYSNNLPTPSADAMVIAGDEAFFVDSVAPAIQSYRDKLIEAHVPEMDVRIMVSNQLLGLLDSEKRPYLLDALHRVTGALPIQNSAPKPKSVEEKITEWSMLRQNTPRGNMEQSVEYPVGKSIGNPWNKSTKSGIPKGPGRYSSRRRTF